MIIIRIKPKMIDVAKEAGVSIATVSHVINQNHPVSAATRANVLAAIEKLGYVPDLGARSFKTGQRKLIGYIAPNIADRFFSSILEEIEDAVSLGGYNLVLINTREKRDLEIAGLQLLTSGITDGIICASTFQSYDQIAPFIPKGFPTVFIDRLPNSYTGDSIQISSFFSVKDAINDLIQDGYTEIGYINSIGELSTSKERFDAYLSAMKEAGIEVRPELIKQGDSRAQSGYQCMSELVEQGVKAVFIANSVMASGAISFLDSKKLTIGKDIQVAAMRDFEWHRFQQGSVRTVEQPAREMARYSAQMLMERIRKPALPARQTTLQSTYHRNRNS